jgi:hypothetical protein
MGGFIAGLIITLSKIELAIYINIGSFFYLLGHWMFCQQYYLSSVDVKMMLAETSAELYHCNRKKQQMKIANFIYTGHLLL